MQDALEVLAEAVRANGHLHEQLAVAQIGALRGRVAALEAAVRALQSLIADSALPRQHATVSSASLYITAAGVFVLGATAGLLAASARPRWR